MRGEARSFVTHERNAYGMAASQHRELVDSLDEANAKNAGLETKLQVHAYYMQMMQYNAVEEISAL